tara:strand:+ start:168 stop:530 length:363 start_codon:yes stop_codon:yes gene_type:complete
MDTTLDCPLCGTHNLKVQGTAMQCQHCGMATDEVYKDLDESSEPYEVLQEDMRQFVKFIDGQMWIPSQVQFEFGAITPYNDDGILKYEAVFGEESIQSKLFSEALGFVIEKFHGQATSQI